jgi:hypothetical protein
MISRIGAAVQALLLCVDHGEPGADPLLARIGMMAGLERRQVDRTQPRGKRSGMSRVITWTVFVYVNTSKQVGDPDHIKVFANQDAAETWFEENDPESVAFEYPVRE